MAGWRMSWRDNFVDANKLHRQISELYGGVGAVFSQLTDREHDVTTFYFSPSAEGLANVLKAVPCEKPVPDVKEGFGLVVGQAGALEEYFPGFRENRVKIR